MGGDRGVCCSPPSAPKPRGFSQALQEPPTQICSQTFPAVWDAEIDSSIHSVTKYFLKIQSLPDTVLCWVCSREQDAVSGPLQGHQLLQWSVQDRSSSGAQRRVSGSLKKKAPRPGSKGCIGVSQIKKDQRPAQWTFVGSAPEAGIERELRELEREGREGQVGNLVGDLIPVALGGWVGCVSIASTRAAVVTWGQVVKPPPTHHRTICRVYPRWPL